PGTAPRRFPRLKNTPLPSGVMPSSSNSLPGSRRRWLYAYAQRKAAVVAVPTMLSAYFKLTTSDLTLNIDVNQTFFELSAAECNHSQASVDQTVTVRLAGATLQVTCPQSGAGALRYA
ncbi:hypothetical protein, partial [Janthinobacterium sp. LB2P10]|uniref:hypothetical protein n=1 Tax=Janthinobacterium sp. LB2P10 TaxID=3424194 RepID=UPI003F1E552F